MNIRMNSRRAVLALLATALFVTSGLVHAQSDNEDENTRSTVEFQISGMSCPGCADKAAKVLEENVSELAWAGVDYDSQKGTVAVELTDANTRGEIRSALGTLGFEVRFAGDAPPPHLLGESERAELDILTVTHGDAIEIRDHLAAGKFTIVDYYADWCAPCRVLEPMLEQLLVKYNNVAIRKVDIVSWNSDIARQASKEYRLVGLPYVQVFGPDGKLLGFSMGLSITPIEALLKGATLR